MPQPLVAMPTDVRTLDGYVWHAAPEQYITATLAVAGVLPVLIPSLGERIGFDHLLSVVDGVILTGSRSNVHPSLYGGEAGEANGPYDPDRDATTFPLIRHAIARGLPLLAICRGMQEFNVARGGTLATEIQDEPGNLDHRAPGDTSDERFALRQTVDVHPGSCLADVVRAESIRVNSLHRQAVGQLGQGLQVEAVAPDGIVEAVSLAGGRTFTVGVQWHPEYWAETDEASAKIFRAFGDAVRAHAAARTRTQLRAANA